MVGRPPGAGKPALFDAAAAWENLSEDRKRQLGIATIIQHVALIMERDGAAPQSCRSPYALEAAVMASESFITTLLRDVVLPHAVAPLQRPDLAPLGVRSCRVCGCTDQSPSIEGGWWVELDLCSGCAPAPESDTRH